MHWHWLFTAVVILTPAPHPKNIRRGDGPYLPSWSSFNGTLYGKQRTVEFSDWYARSGPISPRYLLTGDKGEGKRNGDSG